MCESKSYIRVSVNLDVIVISQYHFVKTLHAYCKLVVAKTFLVQNIKNRRVNTHLLASLRFVTDYVHNFHRLTHISDILLFV